MIIRNRERGTELGSRVERARNPWQRLVGLLGRKQLPEGGGMLFDHCSSIHTFFMRFPIDIVFLDKEGKVLKSSPAVGPFRMVASPFKAHYALELPAGKADASGTKVGDFLDFEAA